jgi:peptidyl-prolyl cis-trans isomerase C
MSAVGGAASAPGMLETARRRALDQLIERLVLLRAARQANIAVSADEVDRELMHLRLDFAPERFDEMMSQSGQSLADLKKSTEARLTIQKLLREQVYSRVGVTEEEIRAYYEGHLADFHQPDEVRASQIVVRTAEQARFIERQIRSGKNFGQIAETYSLSPDAKRGGDLGYFPRGQMPRQFDQVIFKLKVNQVSGVVRSDYGFHLFKLLARRPARQKTLAEVKGQIEQKLASEKREQAQAEYVKMLKDKAAIRVSASQ